MEWISIAALVVAIIAIAYVFLSRQTPVTAANVTNAINAVPSLAAEVEKAATIVVQGIEQARREGKLDNVPAYGQLLNQVRSWLPVNIKPTNEQILSAINSAILLASLATNQINAAKATVADADTPAQPRDLDAEASRALRNRGGPAGMV